ncbi:hypothetical protein [Luteipulveratus mongoliensis]|uniref:Uncharacterized protein n=1 Tax=Luteipulveratus mongoliensis TaxID=571913 RepID=A0A0K1JNU7_9MICO|nr:hypothetical protein [Luteipulveratus mongoliensis]AKU18240.1 hypothetical protein VV02_24265 [Luteipulveratus mongoliensis]
MRHRVGVRRALGSAVAAGLLVAAAAAVRADSPRPVVATGTLSVAAPKVVVIAPQRTDALALRHAPARTTGPGMTTPGTYLAAEPDATGAFEVIERIRLTHAVSKVVLRRPVLPNLPGLQGVRPTVTTLQAQSGSQPVALPTSALGSGSTIVRLPAPARDLSLRYRLQAATTRSTPAPIGRVLVGLAPITTGATGAVMIDVVGAGIRNLVCPQLDVTAQVCGVQRGQTWSAGPLARDQSAVIAQVDLPSPGGS